MPSNLWISPAAGWAHGALMRGEDSEVRGLEGKERLCVNAEAPRRGEKRKTGQKEGWLNGWE
jgi:hypothetical protein